jgi:hypothetical protein
MEIIRYVVLVPYLILIILVPHTLVNLNYQDVFTNMEIVSHVLTHLQNLQQVHVLLMGVTNIV